MKKRFLSILTALALCLTLLPGTALAEGATDASTDCPFTIKNGNNDATPETDYTWDNTAKKLTIKTEAALTISMADGHDSATATIVAVEGTGETQIDLNLTLAGVNITGVGGNPALSTSGKLTITLQGDNTLTGGTSSSSSSYGIFAAGALTISGGTNGTGSLKATGGAVSGSALYSAGIRGDASITIDGGTVEAAGGSSTGTNGTNFGIYANAGEGSAQITINGGNVTATGNTAGIQGTFSTGTDGKAIIHASSISDQSGKDSWKGIIFEGNAGKVYGDQTLGENFTIKNGETLTIPSGAKLTIPAGKTLTIEQNGTLTVEQGGTLENNGTITGSGSLTVSGGTFKTLCSDSNTYADITPTYIHEWDMATWEKNDTHHWHKCTRTGCRVQNNADKNGYSEHNWNDGEVTTPPTTTTPGVKTYTCQTAGCGGTKTETIPATGPATVAVTGVSLNKNATTLAVGGSETLTATVAPDNATNKAVSWTSSNESVATVDSNGLVTAKAVGTATITVTTEDGNFTAACAVTVTAPDPTPIPPYIPPVRPEEPEEPEETPGETDEPKEPEIAFPDVPDGAWYEDAVDFVQSGGLMDGVGGGRFAPDGTTSRAMLWTILARMDGQDVEGGEPWYAKARAWAMENGISDGTAPNDPITREQLAAMLYRYARSQGEGFTGAWMFRLDFKDAGEIHEYAYEAVCWCVMQGVLEGDNGYLRPRGTATRAETAQMLMNFFRR